MAISIPGSTDCSHTISLLPDCFQYLEILGPLPTTTVYNLHLCPPDIKNKEGKVLTDDVQEKQDFECTYEVKIKEEEESSDSDHSLKIVEDDDECNDATSSRQFDAKEVEITVESIKSEGRSTKMNQAEIKKHESNMDAVLRFSNATALGRVGDTGFKCCYCDREYRDAPDLKRHVLEIHDATERVTLLKKINKERFFIKVDITGLQCTICKQNRDSVEELLDHFQMQHEQNVHIHIDNHIIPFKFLSDVLQCFICLKTFVKFRMLQEHMHGHYRNYVCDVCNIAYFNYHSLKNHKVAHNTGTFKCDQCSQVFDTKMRRTVHEKRVHGGTPVVFKCGYCSENFKNFRKKEAHLISKHHVKVPTPKCESCDKVFPDRDKLYKHVKRVHHKEKPHKCTECGRCFCSSAELRSHMASHTGAKVFKCTVCEKAFARVKTLRQHAKIHDLVKKYNCEACSQAFVQRCSWKIHMKSKHGEIV